MTLTRLISGLSLACTVLLIAPPAVQAQYVITGGQANITITEGLASGISAFDAYFNASATRAQTLADPAPGNEPFTGTGIGTPVGLINLVDPIRPYGVTPTPYPGTPGSTRSPQLTTLEIDSLAVDDLLGDWSTSNDAFAFVGNSTLGEQIALTSMQRYTGPFTGVLLYGDFGLRWTGSKLVLTSNIDFLNAAFADIGDPVLSISGNTLTITGDLLIGGGLFVLDPSAVPGTDFGNFTLTANLEPVPVPEPSSLGLLSLAAAGAFCFWRRRIMRRSPAQGVQPS